MGGTFCDHEKFAAIKELIHDSKHAIRTIGVAKIKLSVSLCV
jgi:hypothetical protein